QRPDRRSATPPCYFRLSRERRGQDQSNHHSVAKRSNRLPTSREQTPIRVNELRVYLESARVSFEQRLLCVLLRRRFHRVRPTIILQLHSFIAATDHTDVREVLPSIGFQSFDFHLIVRKRSLLPFHPNFPAIRHRVGLRNFQETGSLPVPAPPIGG